MIKKFLIALLAFGSIPANGMFRIMRPLAQKMIARGIQPRALPSYRKPLLVRSPRTTFRLLRFKQFSRPPALPLHLAFPVHYALQTHKHRTATEPVAAIKHNIENQLKEEERQLMEEFFAMAKITPEIWKLHQEAYKSEYARLENDHKAKNAALWPKELLKDSIYATAEKLLIRHGIDPKTITVIPTWSGSSNMFATASTIAITPQCNDWPQEQLEGVLAHEIQHIINNDSYIGNFIDTYYAHRTTPEWRARWHRFKEKRADILGAMSHENHALGLTYTFCRSADLSHHLETTSHPSSFKRCNYLTKLSFQLYNHNPESLMTAEELVALGW